MRPLGVKTEAVLVHELQVGNSLSLSLQRRERSQFSLLLAMFSKDVREQSQFSLPETADEAAELDSNYYRKLFEVPEHQRLGASDLSDLSEFNQAGKLTAGREALRLNQCLNPLPLALRDDHKFIADDVVENTAIQTQMRIKHKLASDEILNRKLGLNVEAWFDNIANSQQITTEFTN